MKLRNKKTGEIVDDVQYRNYSFADGFGLRTEKKDYEYKTLAEFVEEWEDYEPKEPLIKDEKIRKAVRAWAEANNRDSFRAKNEHFNCCEIIGYTDGENASCDRIEFSTTIAGANGDYYYNIAELCGEEEE